MRWYKCIVRGENFPGELIDRGGTTGFYTCRFVEAMDVEEAERVALDGLRADPKLSLPNGVNPSVPPAIHFEDIVEVANDAVPSSPQGFIWFSEET